MVLKNLVAYFHERFPPVNMMLFIILFFTVYSISSLSEATPIGGFVMLGGVAVVTSFFFRLRVFDEIKDYEMDSF